ncbi:MAG: type II secretion system protein [Candidatus Omnitrophica bacterium]|jgi:prepilin-type N-terminal cleavage/methylation domain|nr:type II secretion system protein [Candidatus Omnitrophota bacterium]
MENRAFTYIEVLLAVVILGLVLIPLLSQFYIGFQANITSELVTQAADLADDLIEEIKGRRFDENLFPDEPVNPNALGTDADENPSQRATFDDVDDYNGWQENPPQTVTGTVLGDFSLFSRSVTVDYVRLNSAKWEHSETSTYYKRIIVTVTHPEITRKTLETIVSLY